MTQARVHAGKRIAQLHGITYNTVRDKWIRGLDCATDRFDWLLWFWISEDQRSLRNVLTAHTVRHPVDNQSVRSFFNSHRGKSTRTPVTSGGTEIPPAEKPLGTLYRPRQPKLGAPTVIIFERDPKLVERGLKAHALTQQRLVDILCGEGWQPRSPDHGEPDYDLAWIRDDRVVFVAEVKSLTQQNEEAQLRLGLGQVLKYKYLLARRFPEVRAVLYVERKPADQATWSEVCGQAGVLLLWPEKE